MTISRTAFFEAADKLSESGAKVNLGSVRKALGGGSYSTLQPLLNEWKQERQAVNLPVSEPAPDVVLERMNVFLADVWGTALSLANDRLKAEREAFESARLALEQEKKDAIDLADALSVDLEAANEALKGLRHELALETKAAGDLKERLAASEGMASMLQARVDELKGELERSTKERQDLTAELLQLAHKVQSTGLAD